MSDHSALLSSILSDIAAASDEAALEAVRVAALGKSGLVTGLLKTLGALPPEERKAAGAAINVVKDQVSEALAARKTVLGEAALEARLKAETIDVTLRCWKARSRQGGSTRSAR